MGKSWGGLSTKIHAAVDALGNPVRLLLTPGQQAQINQAEALIEGFSPGYVIADKGYDADVFLASIKATEAIAGARRLTDEHHANAEHDNITWKEH